MNCPSILLPLVWVLCGGVARADSGDVAAAQALFDQARKLMADGQFDAACPKLEESERLDLALGTVLNLANCYERAGRLASAWSRFVQAQSMARTQVVPDVERLAKDRATKLFSRLSHIVIEAPHAEATPGLEVKRDATVVGSPQWGVPIPADSGAHAVSASAPGRRTWQTKITLTGEAATATVQIPLLEPETAVAPATEAGGAALAAVPLASSGSGAAPAGPIATTQEASGASPLGVMAAPGASDDHAGLGTQKVIALGAAGVGAVGIVVGSIFGIKAISKHNDASNICPDPNSCPTSEGRQAWDDATSAGKVATPAFIVGGVALGAAAVLWFTAPGAQSAQVSIGPTMVRIGGRF